MSMRKLVDTLPVPWERTPGKGKVLPAEPEAVHVPGAKPKPTETSHETGEAQRDKRLESEVLVPILQAVATAGAIGITTALWSWAAGWSWRVPVVVFGLTLWPWAGYGDCGSLTRFGPTHHVGKAREGR